ncbi:Niemann-Pick C1 protein [Armadillidium vulgare]|nr:Niemann-Pick C1 protein [Armadillidium vulgare]
MYFAYGVNQRRDLQLSSDSVFIRKSSRGDSEIVLLDHGLYEILPVDVRQSLCRLWKSIVLGDHPAMKKYSEELGVREYLLFAEMLMQRPVDSLGLRSLKELLSEADLQYMKDMAANKFDRIIHILRSIPKETLLIIRNINTVRAVTKDHGTQVDRYTIMARSATRGAFLSPDATIFMKMKGYWEQMRFDIKLRKEALKIWFMKSFLYVLHLLGKVPDVEQVLERF